jgi:hypothetical protein
MADIKVEEREPFSCVAEDEWTVGEAEERIKEMYGFMSGGILRNGKATKTQHKIQGGPGIVYEFVSSAEKQQSAPQQGK